MKYFVTAQPKMDKLPLFWTVLNDGTVENQEPDGKEIVASMKRAVIIDGHASWHETCFCSPPLRHERSTIYDQFFTGMEVKPLKNLAPLGGPRFWDYLQEQANKETNTVQESLVPSQIKYVPIRLL
jgi:hypothetical protein